MRNLNNNWATEGKGKRINDPWYWLIADTTLSLKPLAQKEFLFVSAERRETVSDQSGWWISILQLSVSTGQQTTVPPCSRQVQHQQWQETKHSHTPPSIRTVHTPCPPFGPWIGQRRGSSGHCLWVWSFFWTLHFTKDMSGRRVHVFVMEAFEVKRSMCKQCFTSCCVTERSNSAAQEDLRTQSLWSSGRTKQKIGERFYHFIHTRTPASEWALITTLNICYSICSLQKKIKSKQNFNPPHVTVCVCLPVCLAASRKRWLKMLRAWGTSSSSTCSNIAVPWTSASSCIPKKNRWERAGEPLKWFYLLHLVSISLTLEWINFHRV